MFVFVFCICILSRYFVLKHFTFLLSFFFSGATCEIAKKISFPQREPRNSGSQLSELYSVFQMSLVFRIVIVSIIVLVFVIFLAALSGLLGTMQRSHITANCRL